MITQENLIAQSAFFAKISNYAYKNEEEIQQEYPDYDIEYYSYAGADVFVFENASDMIIACRGTEVKQISDVKADLSISKTKATQGKIHIGFNHYVDKIWNSIFTRACDAKDNNKKLWITGHSLGAAMATIIAVRLTENTASQTPEALFTYGSPRVGDRTFINYCNGLSFSHHRWVNDGDIVTKIPFAPFFYHCGIMHHIAESGEITLNYERQSSIIKILKMLSPRIAVKTLTGDVKDHSSDLYRMHLFTAAHL